MVYLTQRSGQWLDYKDSVNQKRGIPRSMKRKWKTNSVAPSFCWPYASELFFLWGLVKDPVQPTVDMLNQCFPNVSARGPLLASINSHGSSHSCSRQCRVSELVFPSHDATAPGGPGPPRYRGFKITLRHATLGRTPLDQWSARRRDLHMTTHNTVKRRKSIPSAGFEPAIPASERPQTHA
jgi:hypothetical protein